MTLVRVCISIPLKLSVSRIVSQIFSVNKWRDIETGSGVVQCSIDHSTTFYWSAIVGLSIDLCCTIFELFDVE